MKEKNLNRLGMRTDPDGKILISVFRCECCGRVILGKQTQEPTLLANDPSPCCKHPLLSPQWVVLGDYFEIKRLREYEANCRIP